MGSKPLLHGVLPYASSPQSCNMHAAINARIGAVPDHQTLVNEIPKVSSQATVPRQNRKCSNSSREGWMGMDSGTTSAATQQSPRWSLPQPRPPPGPWCMAAQLAPPPHQVATACELEHVGLFDSMWL